MPDSFGRISTARKEFLWQLQAILLMGKVQCKYKETFLNFSWMMFFILPPTM
jgi:hypothetical protein